MKNSIEKKDKKEIKKSNQTIDITENKTLCKLPEVPDIDSGKYIKVGISVLVIVFGTLLAWSILAPLDTGVHIGGKVVSEENNKIIQNLEGGIVEKIYVDSGDHVKKGDILVKLSTDRYKSNLLSLEVNYYETLAMENRLAAENQKLDKVYFSKELDNLPKKKKEKLIKTQIDIFKSDMSAYRKKIKISSQKIASLKKQISGLNENIQTQTKILKSYQDEEKEQEDLYREKLINKNKLIDIKRKIDTIKSQIMSNRTDIEKARIRINEVKTQLSLDQEDFFRKIKEQLRQAQTKLEDLKARMISIKDKIKRTAVKAPVSGIVLNMRVHTIGEVISPGKPIMEIVPDNSRLIIKAMLPPQYIDYVKVGEKANMTFPAFQLKGRFIHNIEGDVIYVAADSLVDKKGRSFYIVKLAIDKEGEKTLKKENLRVLPGMPASVTIKIGQQTAIEYLLKPLTLMVHKAFLEE